MTTFSLMITDGNGYGVYGLGELDTGDRPDGGTSEITQISAEITFTPAIMASLGDGPYYIRVCSTDEGWNNIIGFQLHDWWMESGGGIPPLRQRKRNDGLTTDTRQERRQVSVSPLLVPTLWWVGAPGSPPFDTGD